MKKSINNSGNKNSSSAKPLNKNAAIDKDAEVSKEERDLLRKSARPESEESLDIDKAALDEVDEDNTLLNQRGDLHDMGEDLDVPGSELDDDNEEVGEEDEENNSYSRRD